MSIIGSFYSRILQGNQYGSAIALRNKCWISFSFFGGPKILNAAGDNPLKDTELPFNTFGINVNDTLPYLFQGVDLPNFSFSGGGKLSIDNQGGKYHSSDFILSPSNNTFIMNFVDIDTAPIIEAFFIPWMRHISGLTDRSVNGDFYPFVKSIITVYVFANDSLMDISKIQDDKTNVVMTATLYGAYPSRADTPNIKFAGDPEILRAVEFEFNNAKIVCNKFTMLSDIDRIHQWNKTPLQVLPTTDGSKRIQDSLGAFDVA